MNTPRSRILIAIGGAITLVVAILGVVVGPLALNNPRVVSTIPTDGELAANPRAEIRIELSQPVQPGALGGISLSPAAIFTPVVEGNLLKLSFPESLAYNTHYQLTIAGLKNQLGRTMDAPVTISFATIPYASVQAFTPTDGEADIGLRGPITVQFAAPIVTTEQVAAAAQDPRLADTMPQPLVVSAEQTPDQATPGIGRWLSPTQFGFYPSEDLHAATSYRVTLRADVSSDGLARLEKPVTWGFRTVAPLLVATRPFNFEEDVDPTASLEIRLAADVDLAKATSAFTLRPKTGGDQINGAFQTTATGFLFKPTKPLANGKTYIATLAPGIASKFGASLNSAPAQWEFSTIGDPQVLQVEPLPDSSDVITSTHRISVRFNHPIVALTDPASQANLPNPIVITPALQGRGLWLDTSTFVFSPTIGLEPSTRYTAVVAAGLRDATGGTLQQEYRWSFTTLEPQVLFVLPQSSDAPPTSTIQLEFNQPMDAGAIQAATRIEDSNGALVAGQFRIQGGSVSFTPSAPLTRGVTYTITAPAGLTSANGNGSLAKEFTSSFRVAPLPDLQESSPANGVQDAEPGTGLSLIFTTEMDWASVERNMAIEPRSTDVVTYTNENELNFYLNLKPETNYQITIGADATDRFGVPIGRERIIRFRTGPLDPSLTIVSTAGRIAAYDAYRATRVPLQVVNIDKVTYRLVRLTPEQVVELSNDYDKWTNFTPRNEPQIASGDLATPGERNQGRIALLDLGKLDAGLYYLEVANGKQTDRQVLAVSPYALTLKRSVDSLFVWAVDLASGKPVANLELVTASYDNSAGRITPPSSLGRTGGDGVLQVPLKSSDLYSGYYLWSPGVQPAAFIANEWNNGINPWDFNQPAEYYSNNLYGSVSTERPIYRPDQVVHIRGVLRVREAGAQGKTDGYRTPVGESASLIVSDPEGNTVLTRTLTLSEFGTFNTDLPLDKSVPLGSYSLIASLDKIPDATVYGTFSVAEYRKPTFEIEVKPAAEDLTEGDRLNAAISARYFAGGNLGNAPVRWRLLSEPLFFYSEDYSDYRFDNLDDADLWYYGDGASSGTSLVSDGRGKTDAQGNFQLSLPADLYRPTSDAQGSSTTNGSRILTIEVDITDVDGQVITAQGRVQVHPASFYIGLRANGVVAKSGESQKIALVTITPQGQIAPSRTLSVDVFRREWYSVSARGDDGRLYWTSSYTDTLVQTLPASTDAQGRGEIAFTPPSGGSYRIVATGKDAAGKQATTSTFTWAYGGDVFWGIDDTNRVDLISDKRNYRPGETAKILVTAPYPGMSALMTIERANVLEYRQITLSGTSEVLEVPIRGDYAPNIFVSLVLLKPACSEQSATQSPCPTVPDLRVGLADLAVSTEQQELNVTVTPDKPQVGPRDTVTYTIRTTDYSGAGVRAEVGLALVDKAVLSLADDPNPTLRNAFYSRRGLGVQTSQTLTALVDRVTVKLQAGDKGGGGAEGNTAVRRDFPDTAFWNPAVITGADGTANVPVTLPDTLTTWRMTARAITADTRVGQGTGDLLATRPLFVRPAFPRFLTAGDSPTLQSVIQNGTNASIDATVTLQLLGDQANAVTLDAPATQQIQVASGAAVVVRWPAKLSTAPTGGTLSLRLTVEGGGEQDAVEVTLPIQRYETPEVVATAGQVYDKTVETIQPPSADGKLDLELVPSLASGIYTGLDALQAFPYDCTEQTVGKFMPNAVTYRLFKQVGRDDPKLRMALELNLAAGMQRLSALQHLDGGWGWWENDMSNPYLTAYVVQGLSEAQKAGLSIDSSLLNSGIDFLERALNGEELAPAKRAGNPDVRAYALFVLGEAGQPDRSRAVALFEDRKALQTYGRAYLLMALQTVGGEQTRVTALVNELMNRAILTTTEAHWEEQRIDYWAMSSNTRTTALALQALVRADPQNFLVPNATRYLMGLRNHGAWQTTQETSASTMALAEYVAASGELAADYNFSVAVSGQILQRGTVNAENLADPIQIALTLADLKVPAGGQSQLEIDKNGPGRLYYTMRMRSYADAGTVQALDRGMQIDRQYVAVASDTLSPTGQLVTSAKLSDIVQVRLTIRIPADMTYLTIEDYLPAGLEALDTSLKTSASAALEQGLTDSEGYPGWWYFTRSEVRDNRVALFATDLPSGTYTYTYLARATTPGIFQTLPAVGYQMYAPEVFGRSNGNTFVVVQ